MLEIAQYLFEIDEAAVLASPKKEKKKCCQKEIVSLRHGLSYSLKKN